MLEQRSHFVKGLSGEFIFIFYFLLGCVCVEIQRLPLRQGGWKEKREQEEKALAFCKSLQCTCIGRAHCVFPADDDDMAFASGLLKVGLGVWFSNNVHVCFR